MKRPYLFLVGIVFSILSQFAWSAPTVTITSPVNFSQYQAPASVSLTATAADASFTISTVSYYNGNALIGSSSQAPYTVNWNSVSAGTYTVTAQATNSNGDTATSAPITVQVNPQSVIGGAVQYSYDAAGQLTGVIAADGSSATYTYDAAGNIISITKATAPLSLWIAQFTPDRAAVGNTVMIQGGGFILDPSANHVSINGTPATVSGATANTLSVTVPEGATTGKITISNANGASTSANDFVVSTLAENGVPTLVSVAANSSAVFHFSGNVGDGVTLALTDASTQPAGGTINSTITGPDGTTFFNCSFSPTATDRHICTLPYLTAAGIYTVTTSGGNSALTFESEIAVDVQAGNLTSGGPGLNAAASLYGQAITYSFSGTAGQQYLNLVFLADGATQDSLVYIYKPDGTLLNSVPMTYNANTAPLNRLVIPTLTDTGTYRVRIVPSDHSTGNLVVALTQDVMGTLAVDGDVTAVSLTNQNGRYTFSGTVGQYMGMGITGLSATPAGGKISITILNPDSSTLVTCSLTVTPNGCLLPALPSTGTYTALVSLANGVPTASMSLLLSADAVGTLTINGSPLTFTSSRVGQAALYSFSGATGQILNLPLSNDTFNGMTSIGIYTPDGTYWAATQIFNSGNGFSGSYTMPALPTAGTYLVRIVPSSFGSGSITVGLTQDALGNLAIDDTATAVNLNGQNGRYTFSVGGAGGQTLGLGITNLVASPSGKNISVSVEKPDGSTLVTCAPVSASSGCALPPLPSPGVYTVVVNILSGGVSSASMNLWLSSDSVATISPDGSTSTFTPSRMGQAVTYSFNALAGQNMHVMFGGSYTGGYAYVYKPDGTLWSTSSLGAVNTLTFTNTPVAGTYKLRIVPPSGSLGSITVSLNQDLVGTLTVDAPATHVTLNSQNALLTFAGTAGQMLSLGLTNYTATPAYNASILVQNPDGSVLVNCGTMYNPSACGLLQLPLTGTYTVVLSFPAGASVSASMNLQLLSDASGTLTINGAGQVFSPTQVGQAANYSFSGTAGQTVNVVYSGNTFVGHSEVDIYGPDGKTVGTGNPSYDPVTYPNGAPLWIYPLTLQATGTYRMRFIPTSGTLGSVTALVTQDVAGTLSVDGSSTHVSLIASEKGSYTFSGLAGQHLGLGAVNANISPANGYVSVNIIEPDGHTSLDNYCILGSICGLPALPSSGTYTAVVTLPNGISSAAMDLMLTSDATGTVAVNGTPITFNPSRAGQRATYTFNGVATQTVNLAFTANTFGGTTTADVYGVNGTPLQTGIVINTASRTFTLSNLPATGAYQVQITPGSSTGSITFGVTQDVTGTLTVDGAATAVSLSNQKGRFTFSGTAGQYLGLGMTNLSTTPANGGISVVIQNPDGSTLVTCTSTVASSGCALPALPVAGTYTALVTLATGVSSASVNLQMSTDASAAATVNGGSATFSPTRVGQAATYSFNGTLGQTVTLVLSNDTFPGTIYAYVYKPDGTLLNSTTVLNSGTATGTSLVLSSLPATGTYQIRIVPPSGVLGTIAVALTQDLTGTIVIDGADVPINLIGNQVGKFTFSGTAGQLLGVGGGGLTVTPSNGTVQIGIVEPNGISTLTTCYVDASNVSGCAIPVLPVSGTYTATVSLSTATTSSAKFNLSLRSDTTGSLVLNGSPVTFTPAHAGKEATYSFTYGNGYPATDVYLSGDTLPGNVTMYVYQPDGTKLTSAYLSYSGGAGAFAGVPLPWSNQSGTFTLRLVPDNGATGSITAALVSQNVTGTITINGTPTPVTLVAPGQTGVLSFNGSVGQHLGLSITNLSTTPAGGQVEVDVSYPNTSPFLTCTLSAASGGCVLPPLPYNSNYIATVNMGAGLTGTSLGVALYADVTGTLTANGSAIVFNPAHIGQAATYSFSGTAGKNMYLAFSADTFAGTTSINVYKPDGTLFTSGTLTYVTGGASGSLALPNLPVTGTYQVRIMPSNGVTGSISTVLAQDLTGTLTVGTAASVSLTAPGQKGSYTFSGTSGQHLGLSITSLATTPAGGSVSVAIQNPSGATIVTCSSTVATNGCPIPALTATGTYTAVVTTAAGVNSASMKLQLNSDTTGTLTVNGSALTFTPGKAGQYATYSFSGTAAKNFNLWLSADTFVGISTVYVYKPDGTQLTSGTVTYSSGTGTGTSLALNNLPVTGTYQVRIVPPGSATTGSMSAAITQDLTGTLTVGTAASVSLTAANQKGSYTFSGTAGQLLGLSITSLSVTPSGSGVSVAIQNPSGATIVTCSSTVATNGCPIPALTATGTYTAVVSTAAGVTSASMKLQLNSDTTGTLTVNGSALTFTPGKAGQYATYSFSGTATQTRSVVLSTDTFVGTTTVYVYKPDGTQLTSGTVTYSSGTGTGATITLSNLPVTGTYQARIVQPGSLTTGSIKIALK